MSVLGAAGYGLYGFSFSVIQYCLLLVDFGFNMSSTKRIASTKTKEERSKVFTCVVAAKTILLIITFFLLCLITQIRPLQDYKYPILCFIPMLISNTYTFFWLFQGSGKIRVLSVINTMSKILVLPLTFIFVKSSKDICVAIILQSAVYCIACLVSNFYLIKSKIVGFVRVKKTEILNEFRDSMPLFTSTAATTIYTQLFTIVLGFTSSKEIVGCYSASERIMRALCFMLYTPITQSFFPKVASIASVNRKKAAEYLKHILFLVLFLMSVLGVVLFWGSDLAVKYFNGYVQLPILLKLMSPIPIAIGCGAVLGQMGLIALGDHKSKIDFRNTYILVAPISLVCVFFMSHLFGVYGITISLAITEYIVFFLMGYHYKVSKRRLLCC